MGVWVAPQLYTARGGSKKGIHDGQEINKQFDTASNRRKWQDRAVPEQAKRVYETKQKTDKSETHSNKATNYPGHNDYLRDGEKRKKETVITQNAYTQNLPGPLTEARFQPTKHTYNPRTDINIDQHWKPPDEVRLLIPQHEVS